LNWGRPGKPPPGTLSVGRGKSRPQGTHGPEAKQEWRVHRYTNHSVDPDFDHGNEDLRAAARQTGRNLPPSPILAAKKGKGGKGVGGKEKGIRKGGKPTAYKK